VFPAAPDPTPSLPLTMTDKDTRESPVTSTHDNLSDKENLVHTEEKSRVPLFNEHVDVSGINERKLIRKLDLRLIPWLSLLYLLSFLDRTSIGNAKVLSDPSNIPGQLV
jgi:hypothetical protein